MRAKLLGIFIAIILVGALSAGYFVGVLNSQTVTSMRTVTSTRTVTTQSEPSFNVTGADLFDISSFRLNFRMVGGCLCANVSLALTNTGAAPITGVNVSEEGFFLNPSWSGNFPLSVGRSISGFDGNSRYFNQSLAYTFFVTSVFADGNATTESYQWPDGTTSLVRVQAYCCRDTGLNIPSPCPTTFDSPQYVKLRPIVESYPSFIALEGGLNYTISGESCGQAYGAYDVGLDYGHFTDQQFLYCGSTQNVTDYIRVRILLTSTGFSLPSMSLQTGNDSYREQEQMCTTSTSIST